MQQIADWLKQIGMQQYIQCFAENDIDFTLGDLTDQDLEKIGVVSLGHRGQPLSSPLRARESRSVPVTVQYRTSRPARAEAASRN